MFCCDSSLNEHKLKLWCAMHLNNWTQSIINTAPLGQRVYVCMLFSFRFVQVLPTSSLLVNSNKRQRHGKEWQERQQDVCEEEIEGKDQVCSPNWCPIRVQGLQWISQVEVKLGFQAKVDWTTNQIPIFDQLHGFNLSPDNRTLRKRSDQQ